MPPVTRLNCLVDSGAYSAWRAGTKVDLNAYCNFLKENGDWIADYIALDEINPRDPEAAAAESFANLKTMRKQGLRPMAVFHAGESIDWLKRTLDLGCDYIGIAGLSLGSNVQRSEWYELVWEHLVNGKGEPVARVHALGDGRQELLQRFPWASSDSASGIYAAQRTGVVVLGKVSLSMRNDYQHSNNAPEVSALSEIERRAVDDLLRIRKVDPRFLDALRSDKIQKRMAWVIRAFLAAFQHLQIEEAVRTKQSLIFERNSLLKRAEARKEPKIKLPPFDFYVVAVSAAGANASYFPSMALLGGKSVLTSFYYLPGGYGETTQQGYLDIKRAVLDPQSILTDPPEKWAYAVDIIKEFVNG